MIVSFGQGYRQTLEKGMYLDVSVYPSKWYTRINMSLWLAGKGVALETNERIYLNFDKFLPLRMSEQIAKFLINKQSQKVAGFDLVTESR